MNVVTYSRRNLFRRKGRTILTITAVAVTVLIFSAIQTVLIAWNAGVEEATADRIATRHKVSITMQLPKHYYAEVRNVEGVKAATFANWFGAKDPKERTPFFAAFAADQNTWFDVLDEMQVDPKQLADWKATKSGAILGDVLAKTLEVDVGSRLVITSDIYPGDWEFTVVGIYKPLRKTVDRNSMVLRWDYLQDELTKRDTSFAAQGKDEIGWVWSRIGDSSKSAEISKAIDKKFDERDDQTVTMSERAFQLSFLGGFAALLTAFKWVARIILLIMLLILANTMAMNVRERTHEYAVMRAIGFSPGMVRMFIIGESLLVSLIGGLVGVLLVTLIINMGMGPFIEENMGGMFPYFRAPGSLLVTALVAACALGISAGTLPAVFATRRPVTDGLRRID